MSARDKPRCIDHGGCDCSRTHSGPVHHHIYGYKRDPADPGGSLEPPVTERGIAVSGCDEADAIRAAAMAERPDLNWHVEWVLMRAADAGVRFNTYALAVAQRIAALDQHAREQQAEAERTGDEDAAREALHARAAQLRLMTETA